MKIRVALVLAFSLLSAALRAEKISLVGATVINPADGKVMPNATVVINGDVSQCDLDQASGLRTVIHLIKSQMLPVPLIEFAREDIVRSGVCAMWVRAFDEANL